MLRNCLHCSNKYTCLSQQVRATSLDAWKVTKSSSPPYPPPPPLPPLPPFPSPDLPVTHANTQIFISFEITSELPKLLKNTEVPDMTYKPIQPTSAQDGLEEYTSSTTQLNKRIPIPTDPTPLILQPPTSIHIPKKSSIIPKGDKSSVWFSTANPVNTTSAPHSTLLPLTVSQRTNPAVTELNRTVATESVTTLTNKTWPTPSITLKMPTLSISRNSSLISTNFLVLQQSTTPLKASSITQIYPKISQSTRKPVNMSIIPVTELKETTATSTPTVPLLVISNSTITRDTPEVTEQLKYSVSSTAVPWMKVTRGQKWILARRGAAPKQKEVLSQSAIVGILITAILVVTVVAVSIYIVVKNRRRVHKQQCMADDSDVRFLTADEVLDFSLARPVDGSPDYL